MSEPNNVGTQIIEQMWKEISAALSDPSFYNCPICGTPTTFPDGTVVRTCEDCCIKFYPSHFRKAWARRRFLDTVEKR